MRGLNRSTRRHRSVENEMQPVESRRSEVKQLWSCKGPGDQTIIDTRKQEPAVMNRQIDEKIEEQGHRYR